MGLCGWRTSLVGVLCGVVLCAAGCGGGSNQQGRTAAPAVQRSSLALGRPPAYDCAVDRLYVGSARAGDRDDPDLLIGRISSSGELEGVAPARIAAVDVAIVRRLENIQARFLMELAGVRVHEPRPIGLENLNVLLIHEQRVVDDLRAIVSALHSVHATGSESSVRRAETLVSLLDDDQTTALDSAHGLGVAGSVSPELAPVADPEASPGLPAALPLPLRSWRDTLADPAVQIRRSRSVSFARRHVGRVALRGGRLGALVWRDDG